MQKVKTSFLLGGLFLKKQIKGSSNSNYWNAEKRKGLIINIFYILSVFSRVSVRVLSPLLFAFVLFGLVS